MLYLTRVCDTIRITLLEYLLPKALDLLGRKFGRWTVTRRIGHVGASRAIRWACVCDCGGEGSVPTRTLMSGESQSCGCLKAEVARSQQANLKHGMAGTPTYHSWLAMKQRCTYKGNKLFHAYGGRGIAVCAQWLSSFETFLADMGERPEGKTLDRYPNTDGNYEPGNCRWASSQEQGAGQRKVIRIEGKMLKEWAAETGIAYHTLLARYKKYGELFPKEKRLSRWTEDTP